jgi:two-component system sensor histidine kinase RpfC
VLAFDRRHISPGRPSTFEEAHQAGALSFVEVRDVASAGAPSPEVRLAYATILAPPFADADIVNALDIADVGVAAEAAAAAEEAEAAPLRRCRVLVADDNRVNQRVARMILEQAGHDVVLADDGEQALDLLTDETFDLAIMDVNMPVMNGIEAVKLYRFIALGRPRVPIIALTADASPETSRRCLDAGVDVCTAKPIEPVKLIALVRDLVPDARPAVPAASLQAAGGGGDARGSVPGGVTGNPLPNLPVAPGGERPDRVMDITAHPRFRKPAPQPVDGQVLDNLQRLGGADFLGSVVEEFLADAETIIARLRECGAAGDVPEFRFHAHALRSGAANIGAAGLSELCLPWETIAADELRQQAAAHADRLDAEFRRVVAALQRHRSDADAARR